MVSYMLFFGFFGVPFWIFWCPFLDFLVTYAYQKASIYAAFRTPVIKRVIKRVIKLSIKGDGWIDFVIIEKPLILDFFTTYAYQKASIYAAFRTPVIKKSGFYGNFSRKTPPITEPAAPPPHGSRRSGSAAIGGTVRYVESVIKEKSTCINLANRLYCI